MEQRHHENWCLFFFKVMSSYDVCLPFRSYTESVKRLRVLLAESHPLFRQAMVEVLARMRRVSLVAKVGNGWDVMPASTQLKPDIILMDFRLPGLSGLEVTSLIKRELPQIAIIILLDEEDGKYIEAVEQSGAWAHLVKSRLAEELPSLLDKLGQTERGND